MVKYDDEFFNNEINILRASAGIFSVTQHYTVFDYIYSNTLVPTSETKIHDDIIDIVKELNEKFRDDLKNFKNVGQRLSNMDNFLKDEAFLLSTELEAEKLDIEKISFFPSDDRTDEEKEADRLEEARRQRESFLPIEPSDKTRVYRVDEGISSIIGPGYEQEIEQFLSQYSVVIGVTNKVGIDGYVVYVDSNSFGSGSSCDESFKNALKDLVSQNMDGDLAENVNDIIDGLKYTTSDGYISYDLSWYVFGSNVIPGVNKELIDSCLSQMTEVKEE